MLSKKFIMGTLATAALGISISASASKAGSFAIGPKLGSQGIGLEGRASVSDQLFIRLGGNYFSYSKKFSTDIGSLKAKLQLITVPLLLDYHFVEGSGFRISAGIAYNDNSLKGKISTSKGATINGRTYAAADIGSVNGKVTFNKISPIVSLGYDGSIVKDGSWSFSCEAGVMFSGNSKLKINTTGRLQSALAQSDFNYDVDKSVKKVTKYLKYYPIVSMGLKYSF